LARTLGCTVRELLARIDSQELTEWGIYYGLNPWGPERADLGAATIAATVANCHATKGHTFKPSDFLPRYGAPPEAEEKTPEQLKQLAMQTNALMHGVFQ